jgi:hypothetical protein
MAFGGPNPSRGNIDDDEEKISDSAFDWLEQDAAIAQHMSDLCSSGLAVNRSELCLKHKKLLF